MSFFEMLKTKGNEVRTKLAQEVNKFSNRTFMEACVAGCVLVAAADGEISEDERQKMMKFVQQSDELKVFDEADVSTSFNKIADNIAFDYEIGKAEALRKVSKLRREKSDMARLMIRVCCAIAMADGQFDEQEKNIIREICTEVNVPASDFGL